MELRHELLQAVCAALDDDAPRLVYADWLTERGDPRGELIQVQCMLAAPEAPAKELVERERALLVAHGGRWLSALGLAGRRVVARVIEPQSKESIPHRGETILYVRGFVEAAKLRFDSYLACASALREEPVRRLVLTTIGTAEAALLSSIRLPPTLTTLELRSGGLGSVGTAAVAGWEALRGLRALCISDCGVDDGGMEALAASPLLEGLEALDLTHNGALDLRGMKALASAPWLRGLRSLDLGRNMLGDDAVWALARTGDFRALRQLGLEACRVQDSGVSALASSDRLRTLTHLDLRSCSIGEEGARSLIVTRKLPHLERLKLSQRDLSAEIVAALRKRYRERLTLEHW